MGDGRTRSEYYRIASRLIPGEIQEDNGDKHITVIMQRGPWRDAGRAARYRRSQHRVQEDRLDSGLFALVSILLQQIPHGFFNQFIEPTVLIHSKVGQFLHGPLVES